MEALHYYQINKHEHKKAGTSCARRSIAIATPQKTGELLSLSSRGISAMAHPLPYLLLAAVLLVPFAAYSASEAKKDAPVQIANPASEYCIKKGGKLEIRKSEHGEVGYCRLPDGRVVEEWALFRAENTLNPKPPEE